MQSSRSKGIIKFDKLQQRLTTSYCGMNHAPRPATRGLREILHIAVVSIAAVYAFVNTVALIVAIAKASNVLGLCDDVGDLSAATSLLHSAALTVIGLYSFSKPWGTSPSPSREMSSGSAEDGIELMGDRDDTTSTAQDSVLQTSKPTFSTSNIHRTPLQRRARICGLVFGLTFFLTVEIFTSVLAFGALRLFSTTVPSRSTKSSIVSAVGTIAQVERLKNGVFRIRSPDEESLFYAQGVVHCEQRMFQMEVNRRAARGELSEILGNATVDTDRYLRTLGLYGAAATTWAAMDVLSRAAVQSYVQGVNDCIASGVRPLELVILGVDHPTPWDDVDGVSFAKLMSLDMSAAGNDEIRRYDLENTHGLSRERIDVLEPFRTNAQDWPSIIDDSDVNRLVNSPEYLSAPQFVPAPTYKPPPPMKSGEGATVVKGFDVWHPVASAMTVLGGYAQRRIAQSILLSNKNEFPWLAKWGHTFNNNNDDDNVDYERYAERYGASNSWVIDGWMSSTGWPLLANDPHLGLSAPMIWMLMDLGCPSYNAVGATLPGLPFVGVGRSTYWTVQNSMAWGCTAGTTDVWDYYIMKTDETDTERKGYLYNGVTRAFDERTEIIHVKGGDSITMTVRSSVYGPVMNDVVDIPTAKGETHAAPWCVRWTALDKVDHFVQVMRDLGTATTLADGYKAASTFGSPAFNVIVATMEPAQSLVGRPPSQIMYALVGHHPVRPATFNGHYPGLGDGSEDWLGYIPWERMPWATAPEKGYFVTANNVIVPPTSAYPYNLGRTTDWADPYRARRITMLLQNAVRETGSIDIMTMRAVQRDVASMSFHDFTTALFAMQFDDSDNGASDSAADHVAHVWRDTLYKWDGVALPSSQQATVWALWKRLLRNVTAAEAPGYKARMGFLANTYNGNGGGFVADPACVAQGFENCNEYAKAMLAKAGESWPLGMSNGDNKDDQGQGGPPVWGRVQSVAYNGKLQAGVDNIPVLRCLFSRSVSSPGGDDHSPAVQHAHYDESSSPSAPRFTVTAAASYRQIMDMSGPVNMSMSLFQLPVGNGGNPLSTSYAEWLGDQEAGDYMKVNGGRGIGDDDAASDTD